MSAGPMDESFLWQADRSCIEIHAFEDVFVAFNCLSGDTHILNFLSASALEQLYENPLSVTDLAAAIRAELEVDEEDCPNSLVLSTLKELDETGLVTPVVAEGRT